VAQCQRASPTTMQHFSSALSPLSTALLQAVNVASNSCLLCSRCASTTQDPLRALERSGLLRRASSQQTMANMAMVAFRDHQGEVFMHQTTMRPNDGRAQIENRLPTYQEIALHDKQRARTTSHVMARVKGCGSKHRRKHKQPCCFKTQQSTSWDHNKRK
jgi:hypothetical protein